MLITIRQEANRLLFVMPGPERLRKVSVAVSQYMGIAKARGQEYITAHPFAIQECIEQDCERQAD